MNLIKLRDWTDLDIAMFELGKEMNLIDKDYVFAYKKGLVLVDSELSNKISDKMKELIEKGILEENEERQVILKK